MGRVGAESLRDTDVRLLEGRLVATTRAASAEDPLVSALEREGAQVVSWPTVSFGPPENRETFMNGLRGAQEYDWIVFTSARAVEAVACAMSTAPSAAKVVAVGPATAVALQRAGWPVTLTGGAGARALVEAWGAAHDLTGARVLFLAGSLAQPTIETELCARGARVDRVEAYRTSVAPPDADVVRADLTRGVDVVTFASPSAVRSLAECLGDHWPGALEACGVAAIGETTRAELAGAGLEMERVVVAQAPDVMGLVRAAADAAGVAASRGSGRAP